MTSLVPPGTRLTAQRRLLVSLIEEWPGSFTVADLHAEALRRERRVGLATTYRVVELLRDAGSLHAVRVEDSNAYVRCGGGHHHHLVCTTCGRVEETRLCAAPSTAEVARRHGFTPSSHELEIYGTCRRCA